MELPISHALNKVLDAAQELVRGEQSLGRRSSNAILADKPGHNLLQTSTLYFRTAAAANQLQRLHNKLDFADSAWSEFYVVAELSAANLGGD
jgi:hypothetical protein